MNQHASLSLRANHGLSSFRFPISNTLCCNINRCLERAKGAEAERERAVRRAEKAVDEAEKLKQALVHANALQVAEGEGGPYVEGLLASDGCDACDAWLAGPSVTVWPFVWYYSCTAVYLS